MRHNCYFVGYLKKSYLRVKGNSILKEHWIYSLYFLKEEQQITYPLSSVLQHDVSTVGGALADGDWALGWALVCSLSWHLSLYHLANFEGGICGGMDPYNVNTFAIENTYEIEGQG